MKRILYVGPIAGIAVVAVFVGIFTANGSSQQTSQSATAAISEEPKIGSDEFMHSWDAKEKIANEKAKVHPEILRYTQSALGFDTEFFPATAFGESTDKMNIHVFGKRTVTGDWKTSYIVTYSNNSEIAVDITAEKIEKVKVTPAQDETFNIAYSDEKKSIIEQALSDPSVQGLTADKSWYIRHIHSTVGLGGQCSFGSCNSIIIDQNTSQESLTILFDTKTNQVVQVKQTPGW